MRALLLWLSLSAATDGGPDLKAAAAPFIPQAGGPDGKIWFTARSGRKIGTMTFP